jgi:hypothetical protein
MRPPLAISLALIPLAAVIAGCGGGAAGTSTSSAPASTLGNAPPHTASQHGSNVRADHGAAHASKQQSRSGSRPVKTKTVLNKSGKRNTAPALPLIKGPRLDVTKKVAACFKAGHAGIVGSTIPGAYEIFNTTGPGGGGVEVAATRSASVAQEVGRSITATGHYVLVPIRTPTAVAAVASGASVADRSLAVRCAEIAG